MNVDIDVFLKPISEDSLCGEDLSFSNDFHEIKKAKTQDDPLLVQGDWVSEPKQADWSFVANKCSTLLADKSKDIRILTWLSESWGHLYGFEGISKGLELSHRMLMDYWFDLHPRIEDDDLDQRLGLLQGLTTQLPSVIKHVPLMNTAPFYSIFDYEKILHQQNIRLKNAEDSGSYNHSELEQFEQSLLLSPQSFHINQYQTFSDILKHWENLKNVLDTLMQLDAPSFASIDSQLENIHKTLTKIYKADRFVIEQDIADMNQETQAGVESTHQTQHTPTVATNISEKTFQPQAQNHIQNREQAIRVLKEIADYFETNEPHSPVSYMLQKTIKWSQMPLHEWLAQVIKNDNNPLETVQELLGVKNNNESKEW